MKGYYKHRYSWNTVLKALALLFIRQQVTAMLLEPSSNPWQILNMSKLDNAQKWLRLQQQQKK